MKELGVIVDEKLTLKRNCKRLCYTISKYHGAVYKVKHYLSYLAPRMLYHSLINSRAQYGIIAWGRAASYHLQPISVVQYRAIRCSNTSEIATREVNIIYKTHKILQQKDIYSLEVGKYMDK